MSQEKEFTDHEVCLQVLQGIDDLISQLPGTRAEHQQRVNSLQFLLKRLQKLDSIEQAQTLASAQIEASEDQ